MLLAGCSDGDGVVDGVVEVTTTDRPWVMEEEFEQDPFLRATLDQIVILNLEAAPTGGDISLSRNTIPYLVRDMDRDPLNFCIPADEPHIVALELETSTGETLMRTERGGGCPPVFPPAGQYRMHIFHDGSAIAPPGQKAFLRRTNEIRLTDSSRSSTGTSEYTTPDWDFFTFTNSGYFVGTDATHPGIIAVDYFQEQSSGLPLPVFQPGTLGFTNHGCVGGGTSIAFFTYPPNAGMAVYKPSTQSPTWNYLASNYVGSGEGQLIPPDPTKVANACADSSEGNGPGCVAYLAIKDLGDYKFNLEFMDDCIQGIGGPNWYPIYIDDDDHSRLKVQLPSSAPLKPAADFFINYKGYLCDGNDACTCSDLNLQEGEVAIFADCNYKPPAVVFSADVEDFNVYDYAPTDADGNVLAIKAGAAASVMLGPNTFVELLTKPANQCYPCTTYGVPEDTPCLSGTSVAGNVQQMKIVSPKTYIADTGGCDNCNLTGVDLSGYDMSNKSFVNAIFSDANLTNASFNTGMLKDADFSGSGTQLTETDFSSATLECTDFSSTVLTGATFGANTFTTDFSCRLNLTEATINATTFSFKNWRYFDLTNATIINDTGTTPLTLSTVSSSLNLSGAILNNVQGLSGAILDGADMGCVTNSGKQICCTQAQQIDLSKASLQQANLKSADLRGAILEFANLEGADLASAQLLEPAPGQGAASLSGAYLKNANLENADLTGVNLSNANFYSPEPGPRPRAQPCPAPISRAPI